MLGREELQARRGSSARCRITRNCRVIKRSCDSQKEGWRTMAGTLTASPWCSCCRIAIACFLTQRHASFSCALCLALCSERNLIVKTTEEGCSLSSRRSAHRDNCTADLGRTESFCSICVMIIDIVGSDLGRQVTTTMKSSAYSGRTRRHWIGFRFLFLRLWTRTQWALKVAK